MQERIKVILIATIALFSGIMISNIFHEVQADNNQCDTFYSFHIFHVKEIFDCQNNKMAELDNEDKKLMDSIELLNINQKLIANMTDIKIYDSIEDSKNSTGGIDGK